MNDIELISRALKNSDDYALIMERFEKPLLRFVKTLSKLSQEDAEDVVQQVFIKAYTHLNDFDPKVKLSSWLFRIARNEVISLWRYRKIRPQEQELDESFFSEIHHIQNPAADDMDHEWQSEKVQEILSLLKPEYREILHLYYFEEKNYDEIADIICAPPGTVAALLSRAKKAFQDIAKRTDSLHHFSFLT